MGRLKLHTPEEAVLDLTKAHFECVINQIRITGTWLRTGPGRWTQCLALTDGTKDIRTCTPCVIPLETSWIWAFHGEVGDPALAFRSTSTWLALGLLPGDVSRPADHLRIVGAVNERLPDLISMPPWQSQGKISIGEAKIINVTTGEVIGHEEIQNET